jgi:hypothetical protein
MPPSICLWIQTGRARYDTQKEKRECDRSQKKR